MFRFLVGLILVVFGCFFIYAIGLLSFIDGIVYFMTFIKEVFNSGDINMSLFAKSIFKVFIATFVGCGGFYVFCYAGIRVIMKDYNE